ncbi:MAG TPA: cytochrome P450 [Thermoanaerobaculia bacterium]|nr:cytochrome P450 [Thermoanaerobaculia bacterium]
MRRSTISAIAKSSARPPGPRSLVPGKFLRSMQRSPTTLLERLAREYGDVVQFSIGPRQLYSFAHPDAVHEILVTKDRSFVKSLALQRSRIVLGDGLLTSEGEFHLRQRRLAQPAFHRDRIRRYGEVMAAYAIRARERWRDGERLDMHHEMMRLTLAVVAKTLFDADVEAEADEIGSALTEIMLMFPRLLNPFIDILLKLPIPQVRRFERALARLDRTIYEIIAARRATSEDRGDLLSMLLLAQDTEGDHGRMTDKQLRDEAMTLFLAGHETTANALAWTWYLLARNPTAEAALHREIDEVLGGRPPSPDDYPKLRYTEMVLAESMRLYPPAWGIGRMAVEDVELAGYEVPRDAIVLVSQWVTHRDARFWPHPERFDPLRFTESAKAARQRFAYFPFGAGSRICIGEGFAWMEGVLILAAIAQKWRFLRDDPRPVVPQPLITLRPKGGIAMRAERR